MRMRKLVVLGFLMTLVLAAPLTQAGQPHPWASPVMIHNAIQKPAMVDSSLWNTAMDEVVANMDTHSNVVAEHILLQPAMSKMIPQDKRKKLCTLVGSDAVPVDQFLMGLAAWGHNAIDQLLKRDPSNWWSSGGGAGPCACEWVVDKDCCMRASTCSWQGGFCGCN